MSAEDNKQAARRGYDAFAKGDAEAAMADISDSIEWVVGGDNAVTGTYNGKAEVGGLWGQLVGQGFRNQPREFLGDGDKVVVLVTNTIGAETVDSVNVLSYDADGKLVRFENFGGETVMNRVFAK
jgi:ketosteroid isomerase-like protein